MGSSEEYLDNLLKSLMDGDSDDSDLSELGDASADSAEIQTDSGGENLAGREYNKAMNVDDIEAMFASMGQENGAEENISDETENMDLSESDTSGQMMSGISDSDYDMESDELALKNALDGLILDEEMLSDEAELDGMQMPEQPLFGEEAQQGESMLDELQITDDEILPDELTLDEMQLSEETGQDEEMLSDKLSMDDASVPDDFSFDDLVLDETSMEEMLPDDSMTDELDLDESMLSDELVLDESVLPDELTLDEGTLPDELSLDEGTLSDELALDEGTLPDELSLDEGAMSDELALDEGTLPGEFALDEETLPDELSLDEGTLPDELSLDEGALSDELALDEESLPDELALDEEAMPDELTLEEDMGSDGLMTEEDTALDDLTLDDLDLGDLGLEEFDVDENDMSSDVADMSEEDIDNLLGDDFLSEQDGESDALDDFAIEESGGDDEDLSALLAGMGNDEDLSEINDLLEKSDQGVAVDDDMLAMLDGVSGGADDGDEFDFFSDEAGGKGDPGAIREITPEELAERDGGKDARKQKKKEERERKKREKKAKKAGKKGTQEEKAGEEAESGLEDLLGGMGDTQEKPAKQGAFSRFLAFLLEEDEDESGDLLNDGELDDSGAMIGSLSDENKEILAELSAEDKKNAKKKNKKEKKKGKKGKKNEAEAGAEGEETEEAKPKKPKKEKKKKKEKNAEEEPKTPEKKLSRKKVISVFLFCATIAASIILVTLLLPDQMEKQEARVAYDHNQYEQVYDLLYGKELSEEDKALFEKSSIILQVQRKLESYDNYRKMDMPLEALDALLEGVERCRNLTDAAAEYQISGELDEAYGQILAALSESYGVTEDEALDIIASGDDVTYSQRLHVIIFGENLAGDEDVPDVKKDVLPEEEGIIDRIQGAEESEAE